MIRKTTFLVLMLLALCPAMKAEQETKALPLSSLIPAAALPVVTVVGDNPVLGMDASTIPNPGGYNPLWDNAATRTVTPDLQNPVSVQTVPQQVLKDQQTIYLDDALQNVSGVTPQNSSYGTGDSFAIRGFNMNNLVFEDGLRSDYFAAGFQRSMQNVQSVTVVKGPSSVLYGQAEPGGLVDIETKKPLSTNYVALDQQIGSFSFYRTTLDATGPLNADKTLLYRFNVDEENSYSYRAFIKSQRLFLFPTIQWKPNKENQVTLEVTYANINQVQDNGIPFTTNGVPASVPMGNNYAMPRANENPTQDLTVKLSATHHFTDDWMIHAAYKTEFMSSPISNSQFYAGDVDQSGNLPLYVSSTPLYNLWTQEYLVDLTGKFQTWFLKHTVLGGFDFYHQNFHYTYEQADNPFISQNIFQPNWNQPLPPIDPSKTGNTYQQLNDCGAYFQDQVELPWHLHLLAGFRYDNVSVSNTGYSKYGTSTVHEVPPLTPRFGVLWQPVKPVSFYGSYTENYGTTALGAVTANGQPLPPEGAKQWEAGIKTEFLDKKLTTTVALYQLTQNNIPTTDPSNPGFEEAVGQAQSKGLELETAGEIVPGWRVIGGYSYINCVTTMDNNSPSLQGLRFPGVPYNSGSLWSTYEIQGGPLKRFKFGAGVVGRSEEQAYAYPSSGTSYEVDRIPAFAVVNAMASYPWSLGKTKWTAQININNMFNTAYFSSVNPSQAMPAAPFNFMASLKMEF